MAYRVFEVQRRHASRLEAVLRTDPISRQSVVIREARALGLDRPTLFVHLEGDGEVLAEAEKRILRFGRRTRHAEAIHRRLAREDEAAAGGLGAVFDGL